MRSAAFSGRGRDHPRSRGVYGQAHRSITSLSGSSPLARGLPEAGSVGRLLGRIIPARAGFTWSPIRSRRLPGDHPRSRGVYAGAPVPWRGADGSSPLARGLLDQGTSDHVGGRIIPARAGFTRTSRSSASTRPDHPRSRGVYSDWAGVGLTALGSSPLARGLLRPVIGCVCGGGIIPARAGFTACRARAVSGVWDHPRSRGVYAARCVSVRSWWGSSPLARGLRRSSSDGHRLDRIIPARAGFTASPTRRSSK